ncbi:hypothetical protein SAMN05443244_1900 [Terriglobus roseus]|uniref:Uncharacterized protein n=1 Tax=Terriglobus roseus TaxID=392734 RepID=A0A1H4MEX4_9BACT|nr:hypothetical protein SAMN05443244_1900 [Terriglobus roseus]
MLALEHSKLWKFLWIAVQLWTGLYCYSDVALRRLCEFVRYHPCNHVFGETCNMNRA